MTTQALRPTKKLLKKKKAAPVLPQQDIAYPELEAMLRQMKAIQDAAIEGGKQFVILEAQVLKFMEEHGIDSYDQGDIKGTAVRPTGEEVDWDGIRKALGPVKWKQILGDPQPVKTKLEALIEMKKVKVADIAPFVKDKPIKHHVKMTRRVA